MKCLTFTRIFARPQIAAQFKGGGRFEGTIAENLERLEWFGVLLCREDGHTRWQFAELQQSA